MRVRPYCFLFRGLLKLTIILADLDDFAEMNRVYEEFVSRCDVKPARTTFQGGHEIEAKLNYSP